MISILRGDAMDPVTSTENSTEMRNGFRDLLGHRIANWQPDKVTVELDIAAQHLNLAGTVHGGVLAALVDIAGSVCGLYCSTVGNVRRAVTFPSLQILPDRRHQVVLRLLGENVRVVPESIFQVLK